MIKMLLYPLRTLNPNASGAPVAIICLCKQPKFISMQLWQPHQPNGFSFYTTQQQQHTNTLPVVESTPVLVCWCVYVCAFVISRYVGVRVW